MALQQAIRTVMRARGLTPSQLLDRMPERDRSTLYRLLNGDTRDARVSTLLELCRALGVSPNDLLNLAGLWADGGRPPDALEVRLRRAFATVQALATPYRLVAVTQVERLIGTWQEAADGVLGREREP